MSRSGSLAKLFVIIVVLALSQLGAGASVSDSEWKTTASRASIILENTTQWRTYHVAFNSGPYSKVSIYLGAYGITTGRCWVDNIQPKGFTIENPSFEEWTPDGKSPVGWVMDAPGRTTHAVSDRASVGRRSVMFYDSSRSENMIRIHQDDVEVKPHTDYTYAFDLYMDTDFVSGIRCTPLVQEPVYCTLGGTVEVMDEIIADRSRAGSLQYRMKLDGGEASMTRTLKVPAGAVMEATASVRIKSLTGKLTYAVEDAAGGKVLGSTQDIPADGNWKDPVIRFISLSGKVRLRISGEGTGELMIGGANVSRPRLLPDPQSTVWKSMNKAMRLRAKLSYRVTGNSGDMLKAGTALLEKDLSAHGVKLVATGDQSADLLIQVGRPVKSLIDKGPESYYLDVDKKQIIIKAGTEHGALYGIMTLLQLFASDENGKPIIIGCKISDWPDFPWRCIFNGTGKNPEWMVRRKINRVESDFGGTVEECVNYGIVAIPHVNIVHYPYKGQPGVLGDPNMAVGVGQTDKLVMKGEAPVELSGRNVVRSKLTGIVVKSEDGRTTYAEGVDYTVIPGEIQFTEPCYFSQDTKKFAISRISGGAIADGQAVLATYEYIRSDCGMMCLAEPEPKVEVERLASEKVKELNLPFLGLHASESVALIGKGPRCQATGKTPSQLLADYYHELDRAIKKSNPDCRMIAWTDDFMPWQNAPRTGLGDVAKMMPKDAIMESWWYGPGGTIDMGAKTARLWDGLGHDFTLMSWYDYANIRETAAVALWAKEKGMRCIGMSSWAYPSGMVATGDISYLDETARCMWRAPRKGEVGYVDVNAAMKKSK